MIEPYAKSTDLSFGLHVFSRWARRGGGDAKWDLFSYMGMFDFIMGKKKWGKPPLIRCGWMRKGYCLNLFGTLWARDTSWIDRYVINHERIHTAQMRELLFIPFYIIYVIEWLWLLLRFRDPHKAYLNISFEREAYGHGHDLTYLSRRPRFASFRPTEHTK